ncbi:MAG TPA: TIGR03621 family F420-dependent LLM class oxidoreductase [Candidatus Limnocylindria bacterium]|nr:TIGR03621 family F420-dependent LLM class oxidoreductase [Candidatus Limnocylindria bacterium]
MQPFRFAIYAGGRDVVDDFGRFVQRAEELGYDAIYITDHIGQQLAPISALATAAALTTRPRIGAYVFANDFRHPLVLAREAAALDHLSGGRLDLGLGAGWMRSDYRQLGLAYDRPGLRISRMQEALGLLKRLLSGETVTHSGQFYRLERARVAPPPVQRPYPRIMIGGGGPRLLRIAAREADIVGFAPQMTDTGRPMLRQATDAALAERVEVVRRTAGARFDNLELNVFVVDAGVVGGSQPLPRSLAALVKSAAPALAGGSPYVLFGTLDQLREGLLRRRERVGISSYGIPARALEAFAPVVESLSGR